VRSYFQTSRHLDLKTQHLVQEITDFEYIVTHSEQEALILEDTLIKRHQPRFNIRLKDDKRYPYVKFTHEPFPRLEFTRKVERDGARYFGPYTDAVAARETMKLLQKIFRLRTCTLEITGQRSVRRRPCLDHYLGLCDAPCVLAITAQEYEKLLEEAADFLHGRHETLLQKLEAQMTEASERLEFERAARLRDQLLAIQRLLSSQKVVDEKPVEQDLIGYARLEPPGSASALSDRPAICVQVFFVRGGKLIGREKFFMESIGEASGREILTAFVKQYYAHATYVPKEILLQCEIDETAAIAAWLSKKRGGRAIVRVPERGPKHRLLEMVEHNAELALREQTAQPLKSPDRRERALGELQERLQLEQPPRRIEAYDISNFHGHESVASMVVFEDGYAKKADYRRFRIKTVAGPDDFASLAEVIRRRLENALEPDEKFLPFPDLILIDGGKGQLRAVREVMYELGLEKIPTCALAKEFEHLFVEGRSEPVILPRDASALHLLQRVRDEAHRFALIYHRKLRTHRTLQSALDQIPGVGPKRRQQLWQHFGSLAALRRADLPQLTAVPGISKCIAQQILKALRREK
jgi:excinuclease ABC subunit C